MGPAGHQSGVQDGPPYPSQYQQLGETPSIIPDVPINAVFLFLFILGAIGHAWQYRINILCGRKFIPNAAAFAFCITRIFTTTLWIVWACYPRSIDCETASLIFGYVGIILLFIINLIFSRRIVRGQHPNFGWTMLFSIPFTIVSLIVVGTIICLIVAIALMFSTRDDYTLRSALYIQRFGASLYAAVAILPILIVGLSSLARKLPKIAAKPVDKFGEGSMQAKVIIVIVTAFLLTMGAAYRAGAILAPLVPVSAPSAPWLSKAVFYVFTFSIEWIIVVFWLVARIDRRFYVPDGAWGPHSYAGGFVFAGEPGNEKSSPVTGGAGVGGVGGVGRSHGGIETTSSRRSLARSASSEHYKRWFLSGSINNPASSVNDSSSSNFNTNATTNTNTNNNKISARSSSELSRPHTLRANPEALSALTSGPSPPPSPPSPPAAAGQRKLQKPKPAATTSTSTTQTKPNARTRALSRVSRASTAAPSVNSRTSRLSRISTFTSTAGTANRRRERSLAREQAMSWGGVTREGVADSLGESRQIVPYPGFELEEVEDLGAADVGGVVREMGWDPKSGKWALRTVAPRRDETREGSPAGSADGSGSRGSTPTGPSRRS